MSVTQEYVAGFSIAGYAHGEAIDAACRRSRHSPFGYRVREPKDAVGRRRR